MLTWIPISSQIVEIATPSTKCRRIARSFSSPSKCRRVFPFSLIDNPPHPYPLTMQRISVIVHFQERQHKRSVHKQIFFYRLTSALTGRAVPPKYSTLPIPLLAPRARGPVQRLVGRSFSCFVRSASIPGFPFLSHIEIILINLPFMYSISAS